jgi:outer membrane lipoprotein-sorting protein
MKFSLIFKSLAALPLCSSLSGCWAVYTTRHLPKPRTPEQIQTATPDELVARLNQRWKELQTLSATVEVQATSLKTKEGVARDYTTFPANIVLRTPKMLRVYGRVPVLHTELFDMASDGKTVTVYIPSQSKAYRGPAQLKKKSENAYLNMRPGFFIDALAVRGLEPDDFFSVTSDTETVEDAQKKHLYAIPEYIVSITRQRPGSHQLVPVRVITFHRDDLLPYEQDIYDADGNLETHVSYQGYQDFGSGLYPSLVTIKRPLDGQQVVLTIDKVSVNMALTDDQFAAKVPTGTTIQTFE